MTVEELSKKYKCFKKANLALIEQEEQQLQTYVARFDYLSLLEGGLKKWAINNEAEQKKMDALLKSIESYKKFIVKILDDYTKEQLELRKEENK